MFDEIREEGTIWDKKDMDSKAKVPVDPTEKSGSWKMFFVTIMVLVLLLCGMAMIAKKIGGGTLMVYLNFSEYGVYTTVDGEAKVLDDFGWHWVWFNKVSIYERRTDVKDDKYIIATFSDAKQRGIKVRTSIALPQDKDDRIDLHIQMGGNPDNVSYVAQNVAELCIKSTAPIMTGEEVMDLRKHEFFNNVWEQMKHGIYMYSRTIKEVDGKQVWVTEIIRDEKGEPITEADGAFEKYHIQLISIHWDKIQRTEQERMEIEKVKLARRALENRRLEKAVAGVEKEELGKKEKVMLRMKAELKEQLDEEQVIDDKKMEEIKKQQKLDKMRYEAMIKERDQIYDIILNGEPNE